MKMTGAEKTWYWLLTGMFLLGSITVGGVVVYSVKRAVAADLAVLPPYITCGYRICDGDISKFGRYADHYYARRWKRMCNGPARYMAMSEAYDLGMKNPC